MQRHSKFLPSATTSYTAAQGAAGVIIPFQSWAGFSANFSAAPGLTVYVGPTATGPWADTVTMEGSGNNFWPVTDQMNKLYNNPYVRLVWTNAVTGRVFLKA